MATPNWREMSEYTRHDDVPTLSAWPSTVAARHYNAVHRMLLRQPDGLRMNLPGLKTLDLIVQDDAWIIVDRAFNDIPVAAWTRFEPGAERGLHEDVDCELRYFHAHAGMIIQQVLDLMDRSLDSLLKDGDDSHRVLPFPTPQ